MDEPLDALNEIAGGHVFDNFSWENARYPFGNPLYPKRNITGGSLIMVVAAFEFGTIVQRAMQSGGVRLDYVPLLMYAVVFFLGTKTFRRGMAFVPADPADQRASRGARTTAEWIFLVVLWALLILAPVAIIQLIAGR
jgi:hypothetical protein